MSVKGSRLRGNTKLACWSKTCGCKCVLFCSSVKSKQARLQVFITARSTLPQTNMKPSKGVYKDFCSLKGLYWVPRQLWEGGDVIFGLFSKLWAASGIDLIAAPNI